MLDYKTGLPDQIWVAGGVGITPFLSWLKDIDTLHHTVDLFYIVRNRGDALYADQITEIADQYDSLQFHLWISAESGSFTVDHMIKHVAGQASHKSVYMCGPVGLIKIFETDLIKQGVHPDNIHYEEFSFR